MDSEPKSRREGNTSDLSAMQARYRAMFDGITSCVAVYEVIEAKDADTPPKDSPDELRFVFKDFNRAAEESADLRREDVIGKPVQEVFPSVEEIGLMDVFKRVFRTGKPERHPVTQYVDTRVTLWVENYVYRLPGNEIVAVYDDVSSEKRVEEDLRRSEERLKLSLEATSDGLWDWNVQSGKTYYSPRYFTMLGYDPDELPSEYATWESLIHPDDKERVQDLILDHMNRDAPYEVEFRLREKCGSWRWVLSRGKVVERGVGNTPLRMVGTHVDIHDRKSIEARAASHVRELEALNSLSRSAALHVSVDEVVGTAAERLMEIVEPDVVLLFMVKENVLDLAQIRFRKDIFDTAAHRYHTIGECLCGMAVSEKRALFSLDIHTDSRCTRTECKNAGMRSFASLPLLSRDDVIGVVGFGSWQERDFSTQRSFLESLAAVVSAGLSNAMLYGQIQSHALELETQVEVRTGELKKFLNAVEHSFATIVITDVDGTIEYVNPSFTRQTGYSVEDAIGRNPRILKSGFHDRDYYDEMWRTLCAGRTWQGELKNRRKDGSYYWENALISPILDENGVTVNYVAVKDDITEKKLAQEELRESELRYKTVFNACRDGILVADEETMKFAYVNSAACEMFGYSMTELQRSGIADIHPPESLPEVAEQFRAMVMGEVDFTTELPCLRGDGSVFYCDISAAPVILDDRPRIMGFFRDVTERREADRLKEDVERITRHDLKSPLNGIIGFPQLLLEDDNITAEQRTMLGHMVDLGRKMLDIINLSFTLLQIERGTYEYAGKPFDVLLVIRRCLYDALNIASGKGVEVNLSLNGEDRMGLLHPGGSDTTVLVIGEELLAYSIFSNLITNAVEACPVGEAVSVDVAGGSPATITVHNPGAVPEEIRATFFEKYVTAGKRQGTGLGTYSAKLLSEVQGWHISMRSSDKMGTYLTIAIPD